jgi:SAM-dependent methyltransferase
MEIAIDLSAVEELRASPAAIAAWLLTLASATVRRRSCNFLMTSLPFQLRQTVLDRRTGISRTFSLRGKRDYDLLTRVFGDEAYRLDRLERSGDLEAIYHRIVASGAAPLILDCGAGIGLSTRYFADAFPAAQVLGVEPDGEHFLHAVANCGAEKVELRQVGVTSECRREAPLESGAVDLLSINSLVAERCAAGGWPFAIRIDVERFDDDLFARNTEWIDEFPLVILELHQWHLPSRLRTRNVLRALVDADRDIVFVGDNLFSIANDAAISAARQAYLDMPTGIARYRVQQAA